MDPLDLVLPRPSKRPERCSSGDIYHIIIRLGSGAALGSDLGGSPLPEAPLQHGGHLPVAIVTNPLGTLRPQTVVTTLHRGRLAPLRCHFRPLEHDGPRSRWSNTWWSR